MHTPFIRRVRLKNYRSIARCNVELSGVTFLVGPNGSGKSNFLDALRFVAQSLHQSLEHALRDRGGIGEVRLRSSGHPTHFGIRIDLHLASGETASYAFEVGAIQGGGYIVKKEQCEVSNTRYVVEEGKLINAPSAQMPIAAPDRLYLVSAASMPIFRPVYDALLRLTFFNPVPDVVRRPQQPDPGVHLARDGRNLASVYDQLHPKIKKRIGTYLGKIVPGVHGIEVKRALGLETLEFRQQVGSNKYPWRFKALSMSDGSLRAFGVLVALFSCDTRSGQAPLLVGLEEPEMALHPAAAGILFDAIMEASENRQILVTTHSPDLLDRTDVETDMLLAVTMEEGKTVIGPIDEAGRGVLQKGLYTPGELLRLAQLEPHPEAVPQQLDLFSKT